MLLCQSVWPILIISLSNVLRYNLNYPMNVTIISLTHAGLIVNINLRYIEFKYIYLNVFRRNRLSGIPVAPNSVDNWKFIVL